MNLESIVSKLKALDLTDYQARVLYALMKNKSSSISDISKLSGVPNTRVYDVAKELIDMDYVIQISEKPKLYRIRNVDMVLDSLIEKKESEISSIKQDMSKIKAMINDDSSESKDKIIRVEKEADLIRLINEEIKSAKKSVIGFGHSELLDKSFVDTLNKAKINNVDVKVVAHKDCVGPHCDLSMFKNSDSTLSAYVIDNSKVLVRLSKPSDTVHNMTLTDNSGIKDMIVNYFNTKWN